MIEFHLEAARDYERARRWYADRSLPAAAEFDRQFDRALERISAAPESFSLLDDRFRTISLRDFPYQIIYCMEGAADRLFVVAVAHTRRRPGDWSDRSRESE